MASECHSQIAVSKRKRRKFVEFFRKYFLEGQKLDENLASHEIYDEKRNIPFTERYRKYIAFLIPVCFMQIVWWILAIRYDIFRLYATHYQLPITMIIGATVAGMTSEGGGAIAFPIMTLLLHINTSTARDFSLMIQSCGMTSAAFTIIWMKILIEWHTVLMVSVGSTFGIIFGFYTFDPLLDGQQKKMLFVSIWFSFAVSLFMLNTQKKRHTFETIANFCVWKAFVLLATGFVGGLCGAFAGSGVDICSFSMLTLLFRVSEKVATPTSVVLMAINTCVGFFWRQLIMCEVSDDAWKYFQVSVPVVVICAPFGSFLGSHFHRLVLANLVYLLELLALIGFLLTKPPSTLIAIGAAVIVFGFLFFMIISKIGAILARTNRIDQSVSGVTILSTTSGLSTISDKAVDLLEMNRT